MSRDLILRDAHKAEADGNGCDCVNCPFSVAGTGEPQPFGAVSVDTDGNRYSTSSKYEGIVIVGEIPTFNDKRGPLSGRAKRNWAEALEKSGLSSHNLLIVPSTHCVPSNVVKKSNREKAVQSCRPSVEAILAAHPTTPVLLMGQDAMHSMHIAKKITANRGFLHKDANGRPYIITYAATTVMFGNIYMWGTFIEDLRRFKRLITNTLRPGLDPSMVTIHAEIPAIEALFKRASYNGYLAVDIETTAPADTPEWGLDATRASLKTIALGLPDCAISLDWSRSNYEVRKYIVDICKNPSISKVFHNGYWFDLRVLSRYGFEINNCEDTRDLRRAISSTSRLSLGYLGSLYCDIHAWKLDDNNDKLASSNNLDELLLYNGYDTIVTARIYEPMRGSVES